MQELIEWGKKYSIVLNDKLEYKTVNGIGGMYAKEDINKGEILANAPLSFPQTLKFEDEEKQKIYDNFNSEYKQIYFYAKEYTLGEKSNYWPIFKYLSTIEDMSKYATYFLTDEEVDFIGKMSNYLYTKIIQHKTIINYYIEQILNLDSSLNRDVVLRIALNVSCRGWFDGVYPILDLFNHSTKKGQLAASNNVNKLLIARGDYLKDEQVYISYGLNDVCWFGTIYHFYDSKDIHNVLLSDRLQFPLNTELQELIYDKIASLYNTNKYTIKINDEDKQVYKVNNNTLVLTEYGPSVPLIEFLKIFAYKNIEDFNNNKICLNTLNTVFLDFLNTIDSLNKVEQVMFIDVPTKLLRFYHILHKEKSIINANKNWIMCNNTSY
jgi:hypothetical protein